LSSISCFSSSLLSMILLSCLTSGLSLGQVPERLARLRKSELRPGGEGIRPKGRAAHGVCEIDEHWKNHVLLHDAVGHGNECRLVRVIPMSVEKLGWSHLGLREYRNTQSPGL